MSSQAIPSNRAKAWVTGFGRKLLGTSLCAHDEALLSAQLPQAMRAIIVLRANNLAMGRSLDFPTNSSATEFVIKLISFEVSWRDTRDNLIRRIKVRGDMTRLVGSL